MNHLSTTYAVSLGLILCLYGLKAALFRLVANRRRMVLLFTLGACMAVPVIWLVSPDWNNQRMIPLAKWAVGPIAVLTVPCVSFFIDLLRNRYDMICWYVRIPLEVLIGVPLWVYTWAQICFFVLGWIWV